MKFSGSFFVITVFACLMCSVAIFTCGTEQGYAFEAAPEKTDKEIMNDHIQETIAEFISIPDSGNFDIDSMLWEDSRVRIGNSEIIYSPDSAFKVFTIEITFCGGYCNSDFFSWLHFNDGSGTVLEGFGTGEIRDISVLPDGKYLIEEYDWGRSSTYSCGSYMATVISFEDHSIRRHYFPNHETDEENEVHPDSLEMLSIGSCSYVNCEFWLKYDPQKHLLQFQYGEDIIPWAEPDTINLVTGSYLYENGRFTLKERKKRPIKHVPD